MDSEIEELRLQMDQTSQRKKKSSWWVKCLKKKKKKRFQNKELIDA